MWENGLGYRSGALRADGFEYSVLQTAPREVCFCLFIMVGIPVGHAPWRYCSGSSAETKPHVVPFSRSA